MNHLIWRNYTIPKLLKHGLDVFIGTGAGLYQFLGALGEKPKQNISRQTDSQLGANLVKAYQFP